MSYHQLPPNTKLSPSQFIVEMNKALKSLPEYRTGMVICADDNGYWLELLGVRNTENDDLLSIARNLTLLVKNKM
jgi:hypothetical protein